MSGPPATDDLKSFSDLQEAIDEFKRYSDRTTSLYERTVTCIREIVASLPADKAEAIQSAIPFSKQEEVKRELQKSPSVFFIGERNCGKSSILNELLKQSSLPVHENPCTARIVRIKYAEQSYARLVGTDGREVKREVFLGKRLPENLIVIEDEDRENEEALDATVEVGLNHNLLRSGIQLIDSPGKSESEVLDRILDDYLVKDTVPLFVYVINGDTRLTRSVSAMFSPLNLLCFSSRQVSLPGHSCFYLNRRSVNFECELRFCTLCFYSSLKCSTLMLQCFHRSAWFPPKKSLKSSFNALTQVF